MKLKKLYCKDCKTELFKTGWYKGYNTYICIKCDRNVNITNKIKKTTIQKIKMLLCKFRLYPETKCPICSKKLLKIGYPDKISGEQCYRCGDDNCKFNNPV